MCRCFQQEIFIEIGRNWVFTLSSSGSIIASFQKPQWEHRIKPLNRSVCLLLKEFDFPEWLKWHVSNLCRIITAEYHTNFKELFLSKFLHSECVLSLRRKKKKQERASTKDNLCFRSNELHRVFAILKKISRSGSDENLPEFYLPSWR